MLKIFQKAMTYTIWILFSLSLWWTNSTDPSFEFTGLVHPENQLMKKLLFVLVTGSVLVLLLSSCAATKRDCNGVKHYKLKNGIYL